MRVKVRVSAGTYFGSISAELDRDSERERRHSEADKKAGAMRLTVGQRLIGRRVREEVRKGMRT